MEHNTGVLEDIRSLCEASGHDVSFYEPGHMRSFFYSVLLKHARGIRTVVYDGILTGGFLGELGPDHLTDILIHAYHDVGDLLLEIEASYHWLDQGLNEQEDHWLARRQNIVLFVGRQATAAAQLLSRSLTLSRKVREELKRK